MVCGQRVVKLRSGPLADLDAQRCEKKAKRVFVLGLLDQLRVMDCLAEVHYKLPFATRSCASSYAVG